MWKTEEEKARERQEQERREEEKAEQRRIERAKEIERKLQDLKEKLDKKIENKSIICFSTDYISIEKDVIFKEYALNYLLDKGYVCVQNETACNKYGLYYILTFIKKDIVGSYFANGVK